MFLFKYLYVRYINSKKLIHLKIFGKSKVEQTFKYSINRLIKFTKCSACLIFPGTASVRKKKRNVVDNFPGILMDKCITLSIFFKQVKNVLAHLIQLKFIVMEFDDTIVTWQKDVSQSKKIILKKILYTEHVHLTLLWFSLWSVNEFSTCLLKLDPWWELCWKRRKHVCLF